MLEAMLVVDEKPQSSVIHIDTEMLAAPLQVPMLPLHGPPGQRVSVPMIGFACKGRSSQNEFPSRCAIAIWICLMWCSFHPMGLMEEMYLHLGV